MTAWQRYAYARKDVALLELSAYLLLLHAENYQSIKKVNFSQSAIIDAHQNLSYVYLLQGKYNAALEEANLCVELAKKAKMDWEPFACLAIKAKLLKLEHEGGTSAEKAAFFEKEIEGAFWENYDSLKKKCQSGMEEKIKNS